MTDRALSRVEHRGPAVSLPTDSGAVIELGNRHDRTIHIRDEQRQVAFGKPLAKIEWQKKPLIWLIATKGLAHVAGLLIFPLACP
jgi:hypothetical protein